MYECLVVTYVRARTPLRWNLSQPVCLNIHSASGPSSFAHEHACLGALAISIDLVRLLREEA